MVRSVQLTDLLNKHRISRSVKEQSSAILQKENLLTVDLVCTDGKWARAHQALRHIFTGLFPNHSLSSPELFNSSTEKIGSMRRPVISFMYRKGESMVLATI